MTDMQSKLYQVYGTIPEHRGYKNIPTTLFISERQAPPVPYEQAIEDYAPGREEFRYTEEYIKELFTEAEAAALVEYMGRAHPDTPLKVREVSLPVSSSIMGVGAIGVGGAQGVLELDREEGYSLPFSVWLFYDLRGSETAIAEERSVIVIRDNNTAAAQPCAICGRRADIEIGPWPFLGGDYGRPICINCLKGRIPYLETRKAADKEYQAQEDEGPSAHEIELTLQGYAAWRAHNEEKMAVSLPQGHALSQEEAQLLSEDEREELGHAAHYRVEALKSMLRDWSRVEWLSTDMVKDEELWAAVDAISNRLAYHEGPDRMQQILIERITNVSRLLQEQAEHVASILLVDEEMGQVIQSLEKHLQQQDIPF